LNLTATEQLTQKVLQLPTGTSISKVDIEYICDLIHFVINNSEEINNRIKQISAS
jgi:dTDP-4-amino-4,6-dideoxygalactose transaminase